MKFLTALLIFAFGISSASFLRQSKNEKPLSDLEFSSFVDPEEVYSSAKAFGDVGVFPNRTYRGSGIKIGIIDGGTPSNLSDYNLGGVLGSTYDYHAHCVSSIVSGDSGVASDATVYFASRHTNDGNSFEKCLRWLVEDMHVDVINHSMGFGSSYFDGYYTKDYTAFLDEYIREKGVVFVNALGNKDSAAYIPTVSLAINAISVGANEKNRSYSSINASGYKDDPDLSNLIEKPTVVAPGRDLYGFSSQSMNVLDTASSYSFTGTSFSAPIVTGIIALLMQEYPNLKGHPETIQSILKVSTVSGIINYQLARKAASNYANYSVNSGVANGQLLFQKSVFIPQGKTLYVNNFVLFNGLYNHDKTHFYAELDELCFSFCKIAILSNAGISLVEETCTKSNCSLEFLNDSQQSHFIISIYLEGTKAPVGTERACCAYWIDSDQFDISYSDLYLDTCPSFQWSIDSRCVPNSVSIFFCNYRNQIVFCKSNLALCWSLSLTLSEWNDLLSLRGREFYMFLMATSFSGDDFYSEMKVLNEPKEFSLISNINPVDFGFLDAYNNSPLITSKTIGGTTLSIERLRCGYIQQQYINLSSKKTGAGHAYLQITFDRLIKYCAFGISVWKSSELSLSAGDTALVECLNATGKWTPFIDLLTDLRLPESRKDVVRFDITNIRGIRFDVTSTKGGDRNKGRLCVDNISFTSDASYANKLCLFTEPIVERETFATPNS